MNGKLRLVNDATTLSHEKSMLQHLTVFFAYIQLSSQ